ncbi:MAG: hypothetical protein EAY75_02045 [Bacteroidetes bacterium]|nr:MAG: hypothetical protein EAY75_02045 [Bacteroidota bacterium]
MHIFTITGKAHAPWGRHYAAQLRLALQAVHTGAHMVAIDAESQHSSPGWQMPPWVLGRWARRWWLQRRVGPTAPALVVHVGSITPCKLPCPQVLVCFKPPNEALLARAKRHQVLVAAAWPQLAGPHVLALGHGGWPSYFPLDWHQQDDTMAVHTGGCAYFFVEAAHLSVAMLVQLLKAFSIFKKRQKTGMKLVIANGHSKLASVLRGYKFAADVVIDTPLNARPQLVASAYAVLVLGPGLQANAAVLQALQGHRALLCLPESAFQPLAGNAAMYAASLEPAAFASMLMQLYTHEAAVQQQQQHAAHAVQQQYNWPQVAQTLLQALPPLV